MGKETKSPTEGHVSGQSNRPLSRPVHGLTLTEIVSELQTDTWSGLDASGATSRAEEYGPNDIGASESASVLQILIAQVANAMTLVLILVSN